MMSTTVHARRGKAGRVIRNVGVLVIGASFLTLSACGSGSNSSTEPAANCKPAHEITTLNKGKLVVVTQTIMPYGGLTNNELTGVDGAIVKAIAKLECLTLVPRLVDSSAVIPSVTNGKADLGMGDWYRTPERLKSIKMSDAMYNDQYGFVSKKGVDNFEALKTLKVGAPAGYSFDDVLQKYLGGKLRLYSNAVNLYQDLKAGRIDLAADSAASGKYNAGGGFTAVIPTKVPAEMGVTFDPQGVGLPVNPGSTGLLEAVNEDLKTLRDNGDLAKFAKANGLPESSTQVK